MKYFINLLTISRLVFAIAISILISNPSGYLFAIVLFFIAAISDYWDGYLARKYKHETDFGEILDPVADKILIIFILISLSVLLSSVYLGIISSAIISREIWVASLRDFNSRNNNSSATKVTFLAKIKTSIQLFTIFIYLVGLYMNSMIMILIADILIFIALLITWQTGIIYTIKSFKKSN